MQATYELFVPAEIIDQREWNAETVNADSPFDIRMRSGYSQEQLQRAFDYVCNPNDWRGPIMATIPDSMRSVVAVAIEFFTATSASFVRSRTDGYLKVTAAGYRAGPAGDH